MDEVRLAGGTLLSFVFAGGKQVCATQQIEICLPVIGGNLLDNVFDPNHYSVDKIITKGHGFHGLTGINPIHVNP
jgi:hypothetical protein